MRGAKNNCTNKSNNAYMIQKALEDAGARILMIDGAAGKNVKRAFSHSNDADISGCRYTS